MVRAALVAATVPVLVALSTGLCAQTTGIAACDDFLMKYEACLASRVPADHRTNFLRELDKKRKDWSDTAKIPNLKAALEDACKDSAKRIGSLLSAYFGCTF